MLVSPVTAGNVIKRSAAPTAELVGRTAFTYLGINAAKAGMAVAYATPAVVEGSFWLTFASGAAAFWPVLPIACAAGVVGTVLNRTKILPKLLGVAKKAAPAVAPALKVAAKI